MANKSPLILWAIPSDEFLHPCATDVCAVFMKNVDTNETHCVSFNHPDLSVYDKLEFVKDLNRIDCRIHKKWVFDKKSFIQLLPAKDLFDINLYCHLQEGKIIEKHMFETPAHKFIYRSKRKCGDLNKVVPILKHKQTFDRMCEEFLKGGNRNLDDIDCGYQQENSIIIETLSELEFNGIYVNKECFEKYFNASINPDGFVYSQYNIYTSTGRPSNHFDGVNYAALNKEDGSRKCFVSNFGDQGEMVLIDYSAFHPRIICYITDFQMDIDQDIYKYLGELYFNRHVTEYDMEEIKSITMRQLYGGVEEKYENIKYFQNLKAFKDRHWKCFQRDGYTITPLFSRKITDKHIKDANPNKLFNYILQATETEIAMTAIQQVNKYLRDKQTKAVLYTYDSLLLDFHKSETVGEVLNTIMDIMRIGYRFPIKVYYGASYDSVVQIYP